jgi:hypothetical protein
MQHLSTGPIVRGKDFEGQATLVPYELLKSFRVMPTPFSLSSLTVTLGASASNPVALWAGDDMFYARTSSTYTWVAGSTGSNSILDSTGAETTQTGSTLGVWYYYVSVSKNYSTQAVTTEILPSQTAPAGVDFEKNAGYLGHPGTSATKKYLYIGHTICTDASTPAFVPFTKKGYTYMIAEASKLEQPTTDTSYAALGFTGAEGLPTHVGVTVGGYIETSATSGDTIKLAYDSSGSGAVIAKTVAAVVNLVPFAGMPLNSGDLWALHGTAAGDVHITQIEDII